MIAKRIIIQIKKHISSIRTLSSTIKGKESFLQLQQSAESLNEELLISRSQNKEICRNMDILLNRLEGEIKDENVMFRPAISENIKCLKRYCITIKNLHMAKKDSIMLKELIRWMVGKRYERYKIMEGQDSGLAYSLLNNFADCPFWPVDDKGRLNAEAMAWFFTENKGPDDNYKNSRKVSLNEIIKNNDVGQGQTGHLFVFAIVALVAVLGIIYINSVLGGGIFLFMTAGCMERRGPIKYSAARLRSILLRKELDALSSSEQAPRYSRAVIKNISNAGIVKGAESIKSLFEMRREDFKEIEICNEDTQFIDSRLSKSLTSLMKDAKNVLSQKQKDVILKSLGEENFQGFLTDLWGRAALSAKDNGFDKYSHLPLIKDKEDYCLGLNIFSLYLNRQAENMCSMFKMDRVLLLPMINEIEDRSVRCEYIISLAVLGMSIKWGGEDTILKYTSPERRLLMRLLFPENYTEEADERRREKGKKMDYAFKGEGKLGEVLKSKINKYAHRHKQKQVIKDEIFERWKHSDVKRIAQKLTSDGYKAEVNGDYNRAEELYRDALNQSDNVYPSGLYLDAWVRLANLLLRANELDKLEKVLEDALEILNKLEFKPKPYSPHLMSYGMKTHSVVLAKCAVLWNKKGDSDKALNYLDLAERINKEAGDNEGLSKIYNHKANIYMERNDMDSALMCIENAISYDPKHVYNYNVKARIQLKRGKFADAFWSINEAISMEPSNIVHKSVLGELLMAAKDYDAVIETLREAIKIKPKDACNYNILARVYKEIKDYGKALESINIAISFEPKDSYHYNVKAEICLAKGDIDSALDCIDKAIELNPKNTYNYNVKAKLYSAIGKYMEALNLINYAIELEPENAIHYFVRAIIYEEMEDYINARHSIKEACELNPGDTCIRRKKDEIYSKITDKNVTCGTICADKHEGSYDALDSQLENQFDELRRILEIKEDRDLTEEEADRALVEYAKRFGIEMPFAQLQDYRRQIKETEEAFKKINIFFSIPKTGTELFWVGNDYAGGHFNQKGTRIHVSLPIILKKGIKAGISIAWHELAHIQGKGHQEEEDEGMKIVNETAKEQLISELGNEYVIISKEKGIVARNTIKEDGLLRIYMVKKGNIDDMAGFAEARFTENYLSLDAINIFNQHEGIGSEVLRWLAEYAQKKYPNSKYPFYIQHVLNPAIIAIALHIFGNDSVEVFSKEEANYVKLSDLGPKGLFSQSELTPFMQIAGKQLAEILAKINIDNLEIGGSMPVEIKVNRRGDVKTATLKRLGEYSFRISGDFAGRSMNLEFYKGVNIRCGRLKDSEALVVIKEKDNFQPFRFPDYIWLVLKRKLKSISEDIYQLVKKNGRFGDKRGELRIDINWLRELLRPKKIIRVQEKLPIGKELTPKEKGKGQFVDVYDTDIVYNIETTMRPFLIHLVERLGYDKQYLLGVPREEGVDWNKWIWRLIEEQPQAVLGALVEGGAIDENSEMLDRKIKKVIMDYRKRQDIADKMDNISDEEIRMLWSAEDKLYNIDKNTAEKIVKSEKIANLLVNLQAAQNIVGTVVHLQSIYDDKLAPRKGMEGTIARLRKLANMSNKKSVLILVSTNENINRDDLLKLGLSRLVMVKNELPEKINPKNIMEKAQEKFGFNSGVFIGGDDPGIITEAINELLTTGIISNRLMKKLLDYSWFYMLGKVPTLEEDAEKDTEEARRRTLQT